MLKFRSAFYAALLIAMISSAAQAQATRTYVAGMGDDINPCSRSTPCRTFAGAISKTAIGGEINSLDTGGFGAVVITKSITIDGTGVLSGILPNPGFANGIMINITNTQDTAKTVRLRGLSLNGLGTATNGINILSAASVSVEDCVIDGFAFGISADKADVFVRNTTIRNNRDTGIKAGGRVGLVDVSLVFNGRATQGPSIQSLGNVYMFGNKS